MGRIYYTDGACSGNPGPGGFGVVCIEDNTIKYKYSEQSEQTTNNREELKAILHIFELEEDNPNEYICIFSDSAYAVNMLDNWIWTWAKNGWINSKKKEVENIDLVKSLYKYISKDFFHCQVFKVAGHAGCCGNEIADALATNNLRKYQRNLIEYGIKDPSLENL